MQKPLNPWAGCHRDRREHDIERQFEGWVTRGLLRGVGLEDDAVRLARRPGPFKQSKPVHGHHAPCAAGRDFLYPRGRKRTHALALFAIDREPIILRQLSDVSQGSFDQDAGDHRLQRLTDSVFRGENAVRLEQLQCERQLGNASLHHRGPQRRQVRRIDLQRSADQSDRQCPVG